MTIPLSLQPSQWPASDAGFWQTACQPPGFLQPPRPASQWSKSRQRIVEQAYGQWLAWLQRNDCLDVDSAPGARVTPERVRTFIAELQERVSPVSVAMMVGALKRMLDVLSPGSDWSWLQAWHANLKRSAIPGRNKFAHVVPPEELMDLGLSLMRAAEERQDRTSHLVSTMARDGLMIAMLICRMDRIGNFHATEIGRHLTFADDRYWLRFEIEETKTNRVSEGELPAGLTPWIDWYLQVHRRRLLAQGDGPRTARLWIDRWGRPMASHSVRNQINKRTVDAFGYNVWPHLFRACAVTGLVDTAPEDIALAPDLLGHTTLETTRRYYILARGNRAHRTVQESFMSGRAEARARLKNGDRDESC